MDLLVPSYIINTPMEYYFKLHSIPAKYLDRRQPFKRVFVLLDPKMEYNAAQVLELRGPDLPFLRMDTIEYVTRFGSLEYYQVQVNWERVKKDFNLP